MSAIAAGQVAPAALAVETTLVRVLPVALSFLAKWLGLDGISGAIRDGLRKVQAPVEKAVTKVLDVVTDKAKTLWASLKAGAGKAVGQGRQVAAAVGGKVAGWLGLRKLFTNKAGEKHTLFFDGTAERPILKVASTPTAIEVYLHNLNADGALDTTQQPVWTEALRLAEKLARAVIIRKPVPPATAQLITDGLERLSDLLAQLGGYSAPKDTPRPPTAAHAYAPEDGALKTSRIENLSTATSQGDSELGTLSPNGWHLILKHRLTKADRGHWVRLHLIGAKSGGQADVRNLVPAPHSVNAGSQVKSFEDAIKRLTESPAPPQNSVRPRTALVQNTNRDDQKSAVVWATVSVRKYHPAGAAQDAHGTVIETYGGTDFAQRLIFKAGLHYFDAQTKTWKLDPKVRLAESVSVELPVFGTLRTSVNLDGRPSLMANLNCTAYFAQEVINERTAGTFRNIADLLSRMELRYEARQRGSTLRPAYQNLIQRVETAERAGNFDFRK